MDIKIAVLAAYFLVILGIGALTRLRLESSSESYFLADRRLGGVILLATMAATNFSAFTVYGTSGAGYRDGYGFFPIMAFGTGFMALSFWVIGRRAWRLGRDFGLVTPPELVRHLYRSPALARLAAVVMIVFTIPYISLQPMAAGYALEELVGLPYFYGCTLVTAVIVFYTFGGGMRAEAWVDLFQGTFMLALLIATIVIVAGQHGGFVAANQKVMALKPELFSRPGALGAYTPGIWFSYLALWFFCDPMFPQLFQRFFAARSERAIARMMLFYPLVCLLVFLPPIAVGVLGHLSVPGLTGKQADRILPLVMNALGGDVMAALVTAAGIAALMSTMDSQLLTLSAVFTRDILPVFRKTGASSGRPARLFTLALGAAGLALAYDPPAIMLEIATETFTGLAVLFPTVVFGLYWKQVHAWPRRAVHRRRGGRPGGLPFQVARTRAVSARRAGAGDDLRGLPGRTSRGPAAPRRPASVSAGMGAGPLRSFAGGHLRAGARLLGLGGEGAAPDGAAALGLVLRAALGRPDGADARTNDAGPARSRVGFRSPRPARDGAGRCRGMSPPAALEAQRPQRKGTF